MDRVPVFLAPDFPYYQQPTFVWDILYDEPILTHCY